MSSSPAPLNPRSSPKASCTSGLPRACLWHSSHRWFPRSVFRAFSPRHGSQGKQSPGLIPGDAPEAALPERARILFPPRSIPDHRRKPPARLARRAFVSGIQARRCFPRSALRVFLPRMEAKEVSRQGWFPATLRKRCFRSEPVSSSRRHQSPIIAESLLRTWFAVCSALAFNPVAGCPDRRYGFSPAAWKPRKSVVRAGFLRRSGSRASGASPYPLPRAINQSPIIAESLLRAWLAVRLPLAFKPVAGFPDRSFGLFSRGMEAREGNRQDRSPATLRKPRFRSEPVSSSPHAINPRSSPKASCMPGSPRFCLRHSSPSLVSPICTTGFFSCGMEAKEVSRQGWFLAMLRKQRFRSEPVSSSQRAQSPIIAESLLRAWLAARLALAFKPSLVSPIGVSGFSPAHGSQGGQPPGLVSRDAPEAALPERARILPQPANPRSSPKASCVPGSPHAWRWHSSPSLVSPICAKGFSPALIPNHRRKPPVRLARRTLGAGIQAVASFPDRRYGIFFRNMEAKEVSRQG